MMVAETVREAVQLDAPGVVARLERAGATLLAMRTRRVAPAGHRSSMPEPILAVVEAYGWQPARLLPAVPTAVDIDLMDEAWSWLQLIPQERYVLRRIVAARALVCPLTGRHAIKWSRLAAGVGADRRAVQGWHAQGIGIVVTRLCSTVC